MFVITEFSFVILFTGILPNELSLSVIQKLPHFFSMPVRMIAKHSFSVAMTPLRRFHVVVTKFRSEIPSELNCDKEAYHLFVGFRDWKCGEINIAS